MAKHTFWVFLILVWGGSLQANLPDFNPEDLTTAPPRIIRTCCAFGADLSMLGIPGIKVNDITGLEQIGPHTYLGSKAEGNGIIYTRKGGFIDLGHLRDQADWTAWLYASILAHHQQGRWTQKLGVEGGKKTLILDIPAGTDSTDMLLLAGRIAFDLSAWHEIATWYGASTVPFVSERYSSFSIEDMYSNTLGIVLGMRALKSDLPYEEAMTAGITHILDSLEAVPTWDDTFAAMQAVEGVWWTSSKHLPSGKILLKRALNIQLCQHPYLLPQQAASTEPCTISLEENSRTGIPLTRFYELRIRLNHKFNQRSQILPDGKAYITQYDFTAFVEDIRIQLEQEEV
ncbi:MAG: DUF4056 domain-containing protein [Bacteroidetes bacterium]|nr:MAG: DUF4056 domain-containing protein [Bacteroidota bacterium]